MMRWYFDFISPYAYLQLRQLESQRLLADIEPVPVLFAGILDHWGQLGPAEIPGKRLFTYRQVSWLARTQQVPLRLPAAHPFNPLRLLRLALSRDSAWVVISRLFDYVWRDGCIPEDAEAFGALLGELGERDESALNRPDIKARLRHNTEGAIAAGVFGVPTLALGDHLFWGQDSTRMALDFRRDPGQFLADDERIAQLPAAARRRAAGPV